MMSDVFKNWDDFRNRLNLAILLKRLGLHSASQYQTFREFTRKPGESDNQLRVRMKGCSSTSPTPTTEE